MTRIKTGGRKANTPNKVNAQSKEVLKNIVNREVLKIPDLLEKLKPKDRLEIILKLIGYVVPKQTKIELETDIPDRFTPVVVNMVIAEPELLKLAE